jgi:hypothetical protein
MYYICLSFFPTLYGAGWGRDCSLQHTENTGGPSRSAIRLSAVFSPSPLIEFTIWVLQMVSHLAQTHSTSTAGRNHILPPTSHDRKSSSSVQRSAKPSERLQLGPEPGIFSPDKRLSVRKRLLTTEVRSTIFFKMSSIIMPTMVYPRTEWSS